MSHDSQKVGQPTPFFAYWLKIGQSWPFRKKVKFNWNPLCLIKSSWLSFSDKQKQRTPFRKPQFNQTCLCVQTPRHLQKKITIEMNVSEWSQGYVTIHGEKIGIIRSNNYLFTKFNSKYHSFMFVSSVHTAPLNVALSGLEMWYSRGISPLYSTLSDIQRSFWR